MRAFTPLVTCILFISCSFQDDFRQMEFDDAYDEINAHFEQMGLTPKGEQPKELLASKDEILLGLIRIYNKWGMDIDLSQPVTNEMKVCKTIEGEWDCKTWVW